MLIINQAIEIPTMENNLLCPMQMRVNGVSVNDTPKFLVDSPDETTHAIQVEDDGDTITVPLALQAQQTRFS